MRINHVNRLKKAKKEEAAQMDAARDNSRYVPIGESEPELDGYSGGGLFENKREQVEMRGKGAANAEGSKFYRNVGS